MSTAQTFRDLVGIDLAGYRVVEAFFLEQSPGVMATIPVVINVTQEPVVCLDQQLLQRIRAHLPGKGGVYANVTTIWALIHEDGSAYRVHGFGSQPDVVRFRIMTEAQIDALIRNIEEGKKPFGWAKDPSRM